MESTNKLEQLAASETTQMIAAILKGEAVQPPTNPTVADKTEQDVLRAVSDTYKQIINPEPPKES